MTVTKPAIQELKIRAEILHHRIKAGDSGALKRLRALPQFRRAASEELAAAAKTIRRADCLTMVAIELGFANWPQASGVISGDERDPQNFGTLLSPPIAGALLNSWYRSYDDAAADRERLGGYLLGYRHQFFIASRFYIKDTLRLDPDDPDWQAIGFDWVRPADAGARTRLYSKLIARLEQIGLQQDSPAETR